MKLKNLEKLIRKTGYMEVIEGGDELWLGNGYAAAPLYDFRRLSDEQLKALFNFTEKDEGKIVISRIGADELLVNDVKDEELLGPALLGLTLGEREYEVYESRQGTVFLPTELLKPFLAEDGSARLFVRRREHGVTVAVKKGFFLCGLIEASQHVITRSLCETLETLYVDTAKQLDETPPGALLAQL